MQDKTAFSTGAALRRPIYPYNRQNLPVLRRNSGAAEITSAQMTRPN
jgi:hypothetical protein